MHDVSFTQLTAWSLMGLLLVGPLPAQTPTAPGSSKAASSAAAPRPAGRRRWPAVAQAKPFTKEQLEQMVAPIALYPDGLLTQIFMAATYPLEVVEASRFMKKNPGLAGDKLNEALKEHEWDAAVKSLCTFPEVLEKMDQNLDWMQDLGDATLGQQTELLDAVQVMRGKAHESGNLKSTEQQTITVKQEPPEEKIIIIESKDPEVVYVPTYSPTVVYGGWGYPYWYYPGMYPYYPYGYGFMSFTAGVIVGGAIWGGCNWGWGSSDIDIDIDNNIDFDRNTSRGDRVEHHRGSGATPGRPRPGRPGPGRPGELAAQRREPQGRELPGPGDRFEVRRNGREQQGVERRGARQGRRRDASGSDRKLGRIATGRRPVAAGRSGERPSVRGRGCARRRRFAPLGREIRIGLVAGRLVGAIGRVQRLAQPRPRSLGQQPWIDEPRLRRRRLQSRRRRWRLQPWRRRRPRRRRRPAEMTAMNRGEERSMWAVRESPRRRVDIALAALLLACLCACRGDSESPRSFAQPEQAIEALSSALAADDQAELERLFGPGSLELLHSGDPVADRQDAERVIELIDEGVTWTDLDETTKVASFGKDPWPFPFPLVSDAERWRFDLETGAEELHSRRIGRNEIATLATLHAYVDAQKEYWRTRPMGDPPTFARYFGSQEGTRNGLYWPTPEGEELSPLGELVAMAEAEGYSPPADGDDASTGGAAEDDRGPYHGYYFRILTGQGEQASGGARSYLDEKGGMQSGFAALAWPASYDNSGIMTFQVNHFGIVFQKDLGPDTPTLAPTIAAFDPDESWAPTGD